MKFTEQKTNCILKFEINYFDRSDYTWIGTVKMRCLLCGWTFDFTENFSSKDKVICPCCHKQHHFNIIAKLQRYF